MATTEYHVTRTTNGGVDGGAVYGHPTTRCDEGGCAGGTEMFLGTRGGIKGENFGPVQKGDIVKLEDPVVE